MENSKGLSNMRNMMYSGKHALLPPKSPFPSGSSSYADYFHNPIIVGSRAVQNPREGNVHHHRTSSESLLMEEQPSWLDDLLDEPETPSWASQDFDSRKDPQQASFYMKASWIKPKNRTRELTPATLTTNLGARPSAKSSIFLESSRSLSTPQEANGFPSTTEKQDFAETGLADRKSSVSTAAAATATTFQH